MAIEIGDFQGHAQDAPNQQGFVDLPNECFSSAGHLYSIGQPSREFDGGNDTIRIPSGPEIS
jgi:hypothetical protein